MTKKEPNNSSPPTFTKKEDIEFNVFGARAFQNNFHEEANYRN